MPKYCNSAELEHNWFNWIVSSKTPCLELYRKRGVLWTKVVGVSRDSSGSPITVNGKTFPDPCFPTRLHCIALADPIFFTTKETADGIVVESDDELPAEEVLNLESDSKLHRLDDPLSQRIEVIPQLREAGYFLEVPTSISWELTLGDILKICSGVAVKFKQKTEEERQELINEAMVQLINKMSKYKLLYKPGFAPVFNLLTTTIHRIMYSIMNKRKTYREGINKILNNASAGTLPTRGRSLRITC